MLASRPGGAIYVGLTNDLVCRLAQHRAKAVPGHTRRYNICTLVWFETHDTHAAAAQRERRIKRWRRAWKDDLIMEQNPDWKDISGWIAQRAAPRGPGSSPGQGPARSKGSKTWQR
ncbi:MAG: GIY-YIG nuclease family protein [Pseudomonadota bacterium]